MKDFVCLGVRLYVGISTWNGDEVSREDSLAAVPAGRLSEESMPEGEGQYEVWNQHRGSKDSAIRHPNRLDVVIGEAEGLAFGVVEVLVGGGDAVAVFGVEVVLPLVEPGEEIFEGGEETGEALGDQPQVSESCW